MRRGRLFSAELWTSGPVTNRTFSTAGDSEAQAAHQVPVHPNYFTSGCRAPRCTDDLTNLVSVYVKLGRAMRFSPTTADGPATGAEIVIGRCLFSSGLSSPNNLFACHSFPVSFTTPDRRPRLTKAYGEENSTTNILRTLLRLLICTLTMGHLLCS